jgi:hypothetical protein
MSVGSLNPCPVRVGGGPTPSAKAYAFLRNAVGEGGSAEDDSGIDGLWRRSRAKGLAAAGSSKRRASLQCWPHLATDAVPYYERVLQLTPAPGASLTARREAIVAEWTAQLDAAIPQVRTQLQALDARVSLLEVPQTRTRYTQFGRAFGPLDASLEGPFGGAGHGVAPNYATDFVVIVHFATGYIGPYTVSDGRIREQIVALLLKLLPSWVSFRVVSSTGFILDLSPLDATGFSS